MIGQVVVITLLVLYYFLNNNKRLPPGPLRLPIIGSSIQLALVNPKIPHLGLAKIAEKYGDIFSFGFGAKFAVMLSSYEAIISILNLNEANINRYQQPFIEDRNFGKNLGIVFASGQEWVDVRTYTKKFMREYGYGKVSVMEKSLNESANTLVDVIKTDLLDSPDGTLTIKTSTFSVHVFNVVWAMVGGYKFEPDDQSLAQAMKCLDKISLAYGTGNIYNTIPILKKLCPKLVGYPEHLQIHAEIHGFSKIPMHNHLLPYLQFLIDNAIEKRSERLDNDPTSLIETFLDKIDEDHGKPGSMFTMEQLQVLLGDFFLASMETTGNLLSFALLFMVLNPDKQNKVRQVILDKMGNKDGMFATELKQIPYVKATILEVMLMGNVTPTPAPTAASEDIEYRDYIIPKDTVIFYNLHPVYNDKAFWKDPGIFRPERFLQKNGEIDELKCERILNTVLGVGSRVCFGELIGLGSLYSNFATLMANFKFETIPGQEPSADNIHFIITNCPDDFNVKVTQL